MRKFVATTLLALAVSGVTTVSAQDAAESSIATAVEPVATESVYAKPADKEEAPYIPEEDPVLVARAVGAIKTLKDLLGDDAENLPSGIDVDDLLDQIADSVTEAVATEGNAKKAEPSIDQSSDPLYEATGGVPIDPIDESFVEVVKETVPESKDSGEADLLEEFLAGLFDGEDENAPEPEVPPPPPAPTELTEEEKAELKRKKDIETAEKRADIMGRHTKWEEKLEETGKELIGELITNILELRNLVAADVKTNGEIDKVLDEYESEAQKAVKGVEMFLTELAKKGHIGDAVQTKWTRVLGKVEQRLEEKKIAVLQEMQEYYNSYIEEEVEYVENAIKAVEKVANEGQADIGMDYSWLDDVTIHDWSRYHDLMRSAKRYSELYRGIFNGTQEGLPANEVLTALQDVRYAVEDISDGFDHVLDNLAKKAERFFKGEELEPDVPGLGDEDLVHDHEHDHDHDHDHDHQEEVPVLGLGGGPAHPAAPQVHLEL